MHAATHAALAPAGTWRCLHSKNSVEHSRALPPHACVHTGALLVIYELLLINVEDADFRDLLFDYRVTQPGIM